MWKLEGTYPFYALREQGATLEVHYVVHKSHHQNMVDDQPKTQPNDRYTVLHPVVSQPLRLDYREPRLGIGVPTTHRWIAGKASQCVGS